MLFLLILENTFLGLIHLVTEYSRSRPLGNDLVTCWCLEEDTSCESNETDTAVEVLVLTLYCIQHLCRCTSCISWMRLSLKGFPLCSFSQSMMSQTPIRLQQTLHPLHFCAVVEPEVPETIESSVSCDFHYTKGGTSLSINAQAIFLTISDVEESIPHHRHWKEYLHLP